MTRPTIAIDFDDVLAHSVEAFRLEVNQKTGSKLTRRHFQVPGVFHHYLNNVLVQNGIDYVSIKDEMFNTMVTDQSHIKPHPGSVTSLNKLSKAHDLVIITARPPEWEAQTRVWLARHFPGVFKDVHFAGNRKDPNLKTKGDMCLEVGASYLVDDNPEHAIETRDKGVKVILFGNYGWHVDVPKDIVRCKTWKEVVNYFEHESPQRI